MRLIDADHLQRWIIERWQEIDPYTDRPFRADEILAQIDRELSIDIDRPQGEWFKDDEGTFICSACGSGYKDQPTIMGKPMFKWCPICGCRMKGADDE